MQAAMQPASREPMAYEKPTNNDLAATFTRPDLQASSEAARKLAAIDYAVLSCAQSIVDAVPAGPGLARAIDLLRHAQLEAYTAVRLSGN